jgi:hypothetical protein
MNAWASAGEDTAVSRSRAEWARPQLALDHRAGCFERAGLPKELVTLREDEGGGEHCHEGVVALFHQRTFYWLDRPLGLSRTH